MIWKVYLIIPQLKHAVVIQNMFKNHTVYIYDK